MSNCIFCQIVSGDLPCHKIYETKNHLAFLSIFPNTDGFSIVIPKVHYSSYFANLPQDVLNDLMKVSQEVALLIDKKLEDVGRTSLIFEGFGVDHIHAKLFPMHGTKIKDENLDKSNIQIPETKLDKYFTKYEGYISSHVGTRKTDEELKKIAEKIREDLN